ncbi:MAG: prepilin-type N-terminal cleavage/methylation domain-containing protein [bacterium]
MKLAAVKSCAVHDFEARDLGGARSRAGFTLIEVVLAMGVLTLGMSALLGMLTFGAALTRTAALRASSAAALEAVMEDLEAGLFPLEEDGSAGEPAEIVDRPLAGSKDIVYSASASPNLEGPITPSGEPLQYRLDVTVNWSSGGLRRAKQYTTLILREVPFGERMRRRFLGAQDLTPMNIAGRMENSQ